MDLVYDWITENDGISVSLECLWTSCLPSYICEKLVWPSTWLIRARSLSEDEHPRYGRYDWLEVISVYLAALGCIDGLNREICKYAGVSNSVSTPRISGCGANVMDISGVPDYWSHLLCLQRSSPFSRKLSESNFLDIFMDAESRLIFLNFLNVQDPSEMSTIPRIPRGLRVSLQGADGPIYSEISSTSGFPVRTRQVTIAP